MRWYDFEGLWKDLSPSDWRRNCCSVCWRAGWLRETLLSLNRNRFLQANQVTAVVLVTWHSEWFGLVVCLALALQIREREELDLAEFIHGCVPLGPLPIHLSPTASSVAGALRLLTLKLAEKSIFNDFIMCLGIYIHFTTCQSCLHFFYHQHVFFFSPQLSGFFF